MDSIFGTLLAFVIVFGILVFMHEFGHFFMAKLVKIRVEVFSFGYGKRLFGFKKGETDYRISLIPMGGYVKFLGEGMFEARANIAADDFMAKKRWQRFLVMAMGSVMNILLAVVIFAGVNMVGTSVYEYQDQKPVIGWIEPGSPAAKADLRIGDEILSINKENVRTWNDVDLAVGTKPERVITLKIKRGGNVRGVELKTEKVTRFQMGYAGFAAKILTQIRMVSPSSSAERAGLKPGDIILAINGEPVYYYHFAQIIEKNPEKELELGIDRKGEVLALKVTPKRSGKVGKIGILQEPKTVIRKFGFLAAIDQSIKENIRNAFLIIRYIRDLIVGQASTRQLAGPLEIANFSYAALRMGFLALMSWIALISLQLGVINLFPVPVLDGGQIFVLILEGIFRRDFNPKVRQIWMQIGFVIFIFLIVFSILNDIARRMPSGWQSLIPW